MYHVLFFSPGDMRMHRRILTFVETPLMGNFAVFHKFEKLPPIPSRQHLEWYLRLTNRLTEKIDPRRGELSVVTLFHSKSLLRTRVRST